MSPDLPPGRSFRWLGVSVATLCLGLGCGVGQPRRSSAQAVMGDAGGAAGAAGAAGQAGGDVPPRFQPLVDALLSEQQALGVPGMAVAVIEAGQVTFAGGFGTKHPGEDDPVLPTTLFRLASNTKKHTALALLRLVEQGIVALDEPVTSYVSEFAFAFDPSWAPNITIEQLLTHGSTMVDWLDVDSPEIDDAALSQHFEGGWFSQHGYVMAPPGSMYDYSNPGFMVAGLVLERMSGEPYRQVMSEQIYAPLGMTRTFFLPTEVLADGDYAWGQTDDAWTAHPSGLSLVVGPESYDNGWGRPCAYAFSSVLDEARFVQFLRDGQRDGDRELLGDGWRQAMQSPQRSTETMLDLESYGYGLFVDRGLFLDGGARFIDLRRVNHHGALPGYSSDLELFPDLDFGLVTLANADGAYFDHSLEVALETLTKLPEPTAPPDLTPSPASYGACVGEYFDPFFVGRIVVTQQGDELRVELPWLDALGIPYDPLLEPVTPHNFYVTLDGMTWLVTFILDAQGQARYFRTHDFVARRSEPVETTRTAAVGAPLPAAGTHERTPTPAQPLRGPAELLRRRHAAPLEPQGALFSTPRHSR